LLDTGNVILSPNSLLPFFIILGPAMLLGFVLLMLGIASRQEKMQRWGLSVLIVAAVALLAAVLISSMRGR
jgi:hypothetical protein